MTSHPNRRTRLDDAIEIANAVAGFAEKPMTLTGTPALDAEIVARLTAAVDVMETAGRQYAGRNGNLSAPSWLRFAERRDVLRTMRHKTAKLAAELAARTA